MLGLKNEPVGGFTTDDERDLHQRVHQLTAHPAHQAHLSVLNEAIAGDGFDHGGSARKGSADLEAGGGLKSASAAVMHAEAFRMHTAVDARTGLPKSHAPHQHAQHSHSGSSSHSSTGNNAASNHTHSNYQSYVSQHNAVDRALEKLQAEQESIIGEMQKFRPLVPDESASRHNYFETLMANLKREINSRYMATPQQQQQQQQQQPSASQHHHHHHSSQQHHHHHHSQQQNLADLASSLVAGRGGVGAEGVMLPPLNAIDGPSSPTPTADTLADRLFSTVTPPSMNDPTIGGGGGGASTSNLFDGSRNPYFDATGAGQMLSGNLGGYGQPSSSSKSPRQMRDASVASSGSDHLPALPPQPLLGGASSTGSTAYDYTTTASHALAHHSSLNGGASSPGQQLYGASTHSSSMMGNIPVGSGGYGSASTPSTSNLHGAYGAGGGLYGHTSSPMGAGGGLNGAGALLSGATGHGRQVQPPPPSHQSSSTSGAGAASGTTAPSSKRKRPTSSGADGKKTKSPRKKRGTLPKEAVKILRTWLFQHFENPYPTDEQKNALAMETGLAVTQVNYWFINARVRIWRPALESVSGDKGHASKIRSGKPKSHANKLYLQTAAAMALKNANWKA